MTTAFRYRSEWSVDVAESNPKPTGQPRLIGSFQSKIPVDEMAAQVEADIKMAIQKISGFTEEQYFVKASGTLRNTLQEFMEGVNVELSEDGVEVTIDGWLPLALEEGTGRFDMKPGLLAGRQHRTIPMHDGGFRRVSENSPASSWWHPGLQAANISEQVKEEVEPYAEELFKRIFDRVKA
jgi:hypothetical protein